MNKLRIGVYIETGFNAKIGGAFSYSERLIEMIDLYNFDEKIEIIFIAKNKIDVTFYKKEVLRIPIEEIEKKNWRFKQKIVFKIASSIFLKHFLFHQRLIEKRDKNNSLDITNFLLKNKIDLIYYLTPNLKPFNFPFIATHWDLGYKSMWVYQEVFSNTRFESREYYHRVTLQKAFAVFVESEQSKKELIHYERINPQRIFIVPLFPGKVVEMDVNIEDQKTILNKWKVDKNKFYFYPAQFWAHKNQFGLVMAFKKVNQQYPEFKLVLSGHNHGTMDYIKKIVKEEQLDENVIFTEFVSNEEIFTFYKNAIALVMPTLLGPTNMPLLEAHYLGCPVLCSNLDGHKEQMKERAIYFDPLDHNDIANKMINIVDMPKIKIVKDNFDIPILLNNHFLKIYNARKTFE